MESYCNLTGEQQGKLLRTIGEIAHMDGDDYADQFARELREFIDSLVRFGFTTPVMRQKYYIYIDDSLRDRKKKK
ncbi:MAG: hypothetical protein E7649_06225 [Ruminococcaceae bacterium]|nr:hypothetical protein [Oscillospiraceae bacterium]